MTSRSWPSADAATAASTQVRTIGPYVSRVRSRPGLTTRAWCNGIGRPAVSTSPFSWYRRFGSKKITGSSDAIACWIIQ